MKIILNACFLLILFLSNNLVAQQKPKSEVDKILEYEARKEIIYDSILKHVAKKWEISVGYGVWTFMNSSKSDNPEEPFYLPSGMSHWNFLLAWHITEKNSIDLSVGIQQKKNIPPQPNIFQIIGGYNIEIEGSGGGFVPIKLGTTFYPKPGRFRPFVGTNAGLLIAKSQYTEAKGNRFDGITRTDYIMKGKVPVLGLSTGFDYRAGEYVSFNICTEYNISGKFDEPIGGYNMYHGFLFIGQLAIIF